MNPGGWRTALRISARETRRAKGRSALVLAMIALPVAALAFAAVSFDTFRLTAAERLDRQLGSNDAELTWLGGSIRQDLTGDNWDITRPEYEADQPDAGAVAALLPPGSRIAPYATPSWRTLLAPGDVVDLEFREFDLADPVTDHLGVLLAGRLPADRTEALATRRALDRLGLTLGDRMEPLDGGPSHTVVGIVELPENLGEAVVVPPGTGSQPGGRWLVDTPGELNWATVQRLNAAGLLVVSRSVRDAPSDPAAGLPTPPSGGSTEEISVGVLVGGLGLLEVVLLAGPALAVGALRRRRDLALVAANGGTPAHLRRIVLADGLLLGGGGAVVGLAVGVAAALTGRHLLELYVFQARSGSPRFFPAALLAIAGLALVAGLLAALVPAFTAARQDVVTALTGRRGLVRSRRRWLVGGLALTAAGTALAMFGASRPTTSLILGGLVLAEIGLVLCTPSVVGLLARVGRFLPLAPRIALRDTARNRAAAAPAISAVLAAVAGSVALGAYAASSDTRQFGIGEPTVPPGYVHVSFRTVSSGAPTPPRDRVAAAAESHLPVTALAELRFPACPDASGPARYCSVAALVPPEQACPYQAGQATEREQRLALVDPRCERPSDYVEGPPVVGTVVDDGSGLSALTGASSAQISRAAETLRAGGVVVTDPRLISAGQVSLELRRETENRPEVDRTVVRLPAYALDCPFGVAREIISPATLAGLGLGSEPAGYLVATSRPPDARQRAAFAAAMREIAPLTVVEVVDERGTTTTPTLLVLAGAAGLITLGAAGMATALAAAEGRADLSTLAAIGASPRVRRLLAMSQAGVIAGLGSLLGAAAGLTAAVAVLTAMNQSLGPIWPADPPYPVVVPWLTLGVLMLVPVAAVLGAGLLTRSRLPIERRIE
nr:FtsX-like permease family protein [Micromonospora sp. DSM 115978]